MISTTSRNGILFIANREALVLTAYQDGKHASVGFGTNDPTLKVGDKITVKRAFELLKDGIAVRDKIIARALKVEVSQQQWDGVSAFYYQNGNKPDGHGRPGFARMMSLINAKSFAEAAAYFPECDRDSHGQQRDGLHKRRLLEQVVFLRGDYGQLDPIPYWPGDPRKTKRQEYRLQPDDL